MRKNIEKLTAELSRLPKKKTVKNSQVSTFPDSRFADISVIDTSDMETLWGKEITDRVRTVDKRSTIGMDYDKAMKDIEKRLASLKE